MNMKIYQMMKKTNEKKLLHYTEIKDDNKFNFNYEVSIMEI